MWICPDCRQLYESKQANCDRDDAPLAEVQAHQTKSRYPLLGQIIGDRYHLIGGLGQGGLGTVYLAKHMHLGQLFALKFLDLDTLGVDPDTGKKDGYINDFLKEARVASLIRHDAVVKVSDFGERDHLPYLVMEYVPGPSLLQMLAGQGRFTEPDAINIARRIAEALDAFHERRLVHRDLKPANVILDPRGGGRLTLVDLGLVKDLSGPGGKASTHPLALRGTPGYLAPEQVPPWVIAGAGGEITGEKQVVDARVDLYALGVLFYEMLAGVSPYPAGSSTQIIVYACTKDAIPLSSVQPPIRLRPGLEQLVHDTMHRNPERRPATAGEFIERLDELTMGAALKGSWPSIVIPDSRRSQRMPAVSPAPNDLDSLELLAPPSRPADAPPTPSARPGGGLIPPLDLEDSMEGTAVYDRDSTGVPSGQSRHRPTAPVDQTIEADVDSLDMLMDGPGLTDSVIDDSEMATRIDDFALDDDQTEAADAPLPKRSVPAGAPLGRGGEVEPPPPLRAKRKQGVAVWILAIAACVLVTVAVVLALRSKGPPTAKDPQPATGSADAMVVNMAPVEHNIVAAKQIDAAPVPKQPDAAPPPPVVDAAVPAPKPVKPRRDKPKPKVDKPKPKVDKPKPKPGLGAIERALAGGDKAYAARDFAQALNHYRKFRRLADRRHPRYNAIGQRVTALKGMVEK